jgi:hypothetical protein
VVIDDLAVASVEEIWIDAWKWTGSGRVAGGFELLPGREARVGPARLEVSAGELLHGDSKVAQRTFGAVWCELPRFDTQAYPGNDAWKIMSGGSELRGDLAGLAKWVAILLDLEDLHVTGRLAAGPSRLALTSLRLLAGDFSLEGDYRSSPGRRHGDFRATKGPLSIRFTIPSGS